jgi:hypothetical protein
VTKWGVTRVSGADLSWQCLWTLAHFRSFSLTFFIFQCQVMDRFTTWYSLQCQELGDIFLHHIGNIRYVSNIKWFSRLIMLFMIIFKIVVF